MDLPAFVATLMQEQDRDVLRESVLAQASMEVEVPEPVKALGPDGILKSQASRMCQKLNTVVEPFRKRRLTEESPCLWVDATYYKVRVDGHIVSQATAVAWGTVRRTLRRAPRWQEYSARQGAR